MARKRRSSRVPDSEFFGSLVTYLHAQRDAERCPTPVTAATIAQLLDHSLAPRDGQRVRRHLADCLFCLNAYAELRGAHETELTLPRAVAPGPARTAAARSDLFGRVRAWRDAVSDVIRNFQHRAVQAAYSEPSFSLGLVDSRSFASLVRERGPGPPGHALGQLDVVERALTELLETLRTLRQLALRERALRNEIEHAAMPRDATQDLLQQLDRDRESLAELIERAVHRSARFTR